MEFRSNLEFMERLRGLIHQWCDEKRLAELSRILPSYLAFNGLTDGWAELLNGLKNVRALGADSFVESEWLLLNDLIHAADQALSVR